MLTFVELCLHPASSNFPDTFAIFVLFLLLIYFVYDELCDFSLCQFDGILTNRVHLLVVMAFAFELVCMIRILIRVALASLIDLNVYCRYSLGFRIYIFLYHHACISPSVLIHSRSHADGLEMASAA